MKRISIFLACVTAIFFYKQLVYHHVLYCCDNLTIIVPSRYLLVHSLRSGVLPYVNPYIFSGSPFIADINLALFSPLNLLYFFMAPFRALTLSVIINFFISSIGMYICARRQSLTQHASLVSAIVYSFSGTMFVYTNNISLLQVAALAPWVVASWDWYAKSGSKIALLSSIGVTTMQIFSGHPQIVYYTWILGMTYIFWTDTQKIVHIKRVFIIQSISLLVSAIQLFPFIELVLSSTRVQAGYMYATQGSATVFDFIRFVLPTIVGNQSLQFVMARGGSLYGYVGVVALLLASYVDRKNTRVMFFIVASIVSLLLSLGAHTPIYWFVYTFIPGIGLFRSPEHMLFIYTFSISTLAAYGFDRCMKLELSRVRVIFGVCAYVGIVCCANIVVARDVWSYIESHVPYVQAKHAFLSYEHVKQWMYLISQNALTSSILLCVVWIGMKVRSKWLLLCLITIELFIFSRNNLITIPMTNVTAWIADGEVTAQRIKRGADVDTRIFTDQTSYFFPDATGKPYVNMPGEAQWQFKILRPNLPILYGLSTIDGYASIVDSRYAKNFEKHPSDPTGISIPINDALLSKWNVGAVIYQDNGKVMIKALQDKSNITRKNAYVEWPFHIGSLLSGVGLIACFVICAMYVKEKRISVHN